MTLSRIVANRRAWLTNRAAQAHLSDVRGRCPRGGARPVDPADRERGLQARVPGHRVPAARGFAAGAVPARADEARAVPQRSQYRIDLRLLRVGAGAVAGHGRRLDCRGDQRRAARDRRAAEGQIALLRCRPGACAPRQPLRRDDEGKRQFVVCSGGGPSFMEAANRGAADEGQDTIGAQHRASARAASQSLRDPGPQLPVPLFRASQDALPAARAGSRGVPRRLWHLRRIVRASDPGPDRQGAAAADPAVRPRLLEPGRQFPGDGRGRRDFTARPRPDPLERGRRRSVGIRHGLLRATSRAGARSDRGPPE